MSSAERRQELLEVLCRRRHDTYDNLARDFNVSKMTIRRDVAALMCKYPVETVHGGRHGCIRVMDGLYLNRRYDRKTFTPKQTELLERLGGQLAGEDLTTMGSIIFQLAP